MELRNTPPCRELADFVECYWYVKVDAFESSRRPDAILPTGTSNLIFNLSGCPHREYTDSGLREFESLKTRWFSGIRDSPVIVGPTVCTHVVGIRFKPAGLIPFLNVSSAELAETTVDPTALWGRQCQEIQNRLFETSHVDAQFRLLEQWLLHIYDPKRVLEGVLHSLNHLQKSAGNVSIETLARMANLSLRQFRRRFESAVGISPKRMARILRFQRLIQRIGSPSKHPNWSGLAYDCGYYDQAHLIADFRDFANVTPTEYLRRKPIVPGFLPVDAAMSLFSNTDRRRPDRMAAS